jgi:hypothetical protein
LASLLQAFAAEPLPVRAQVNDRERSFYGDLRGTCRKRASSAAPVSAGKSRHEKRDESVAGFIPFTALRQ